MPEWRVILAHEIGEDLKWLVSDYGAHMPRINLKQYSTTSDSISIEDVAPQAPDMKRMAKMNLFKGPLQC